MRNFWKHKSIKLVNNYKGRKNLLSKPSYYLSKWFLEKSTAIEKRKIQIKMNTLWVLVWLNKEKNIIKSRNMLYWYR